MEVVNLQDGHRGGQGIDDGWSWWSVPVRRVNKGRPVWTCPDKQKVAALLPLVIADQQGIFKKHATFNTHVQNTPSAIYTGTYITIYDTSALCWLSHAKVSLPIALQEHEEQMGTALCEHEHWTVENMRVSCYICPDSFNTTRKV